jgi:exonuclease VII small subunit
LQRPKSNGFPLHLAPVQAGLAVRMIPDQDSRKSDEEIERKQTALRPQSRPALRSERRSSSSRGHPQAPRREDRQGFPSAQRQGSPQNSALRTAITEVRQIIESLEGVLTDLQRVLEILERAAQEQKATDDEIEELRRELSAFRQRRERIQPHKILQP